MQSPHVGITASLPVAAACSAVIPVYNTSTRPRMHMMHAASGPQLPANVARPHIAVHNGQMAERCNKLYDAANAADVQGTRMTSVHAQVWQQNSQFSPHQQNSRLHMQPVPAYVMTQQPRIQTPVSGCGTVPEWSRFSGHLPYQQSERLPQRHQLQQQRHMLPAGTVLRQQLPTYQNAVDHRYNQEMMLKLTWQQQRQQQQRHLMRFQSVSHHYSSIAGVASEPCDIGGFRQAASSGCMMSVTSSYAIPATAVSSAI